jgi:hypothetical protein
LLEGFGYSVQLQEGPAEFGSDLLVQISNEFLVRPIVVGIQIGSYEGSVNASQVQLKLDQLLAGWDRNHLDAGALILAGECGSESRQVVHNHNLKEPSRTVKLLDGADLARIVLLRSIATQA